MVAILPPITQQDIGKTVISELEPGYTAFLESTIDQNVYTIKQGYIEFVDSDGKIRFVKRLDSTQTLVATIYSNGIISGLELQPVNGNTVKITAGKAVFPSGQKNLAEQNIVIPGGTTTIYYVFIDASGTVETSELYIPEITQLTLGCVYTTGTNVIKVFVNRRDNLIDMFDRFSDLMYALGYFYSGFHLSYVATTSSLVSTDGVIHNNPNGDKRWPSNQKISLQKIYSGTTFGPESSTINVDFLKEISLPNGTSTTIPANNSVFHFVYISRSTGKYFILMADITIPKTLVTVEITDLINVVNRVNQGEFVQRHCVLLAAIGVYFNSTANTDITLIQIHRGISGARGFGTGIYPSPEDYPGGGILKAKIGSYYLFQGVDSYILQASATLGKDKYVAVCNKNNPNLVELREYGKTRNVKIHEYSIMNIEKTKCHEIFNTIGINSITTDTLINSTSQPTIGFPRITLGVQTTGKVQDENNISILAGIGGCEFRPRLGIITKAPGAASILYNFRSSKDTAYQNSYINRQAATLTNKYMRIFEHLNNDQPIAYKNLYSTYLTSGTKDFRDRLLKDQGLMDTLKTKIQALYNTRPYKYESWSCIPVYSISSSPNISTQGGVEIIYTSIADLTYKSTSITLNPIQPSDVAFLDSPIMTNDVLDHFLVITQCGGVYEDNAPDKPYYNKTRTLRITSIPYADLPYTGQPT